MDERLRKQLLDRLDFYRELGIEDFYRRKPGEVKPAVAAERISGPIAAMSSKPQKPAESNARPEPAQATPRAASPAAQPMGLFDAPAAPRKERETLEEIRTDLGDCHRCFLAGGRKTIVFGQGNPHAELVFVGEGPGADEDEQGFPFVGRAGQLLNKMIQLAGMKREEVYICNVVKCRPPNNRTPDREEIEACSPFMLRQIRAIRPKLVCCLGAPAVKTVLGIKEGITKIRGQFYDFEGTKAIATVHPAYILRNPREERILREDFEKIVQYLGRK